MDSFPAHRYGGARSLVILHDHHLRQFLKVWRQARAAGVILPETDDPAYVSLNALLAHVCSSPRRYMIWMCEVLGLQDPEIRLPLGPDEIENGAAEYITHLTDRWKQPLAQVEEARFYKPEYPAPWGVKYCVDAMLEHAVMHPVRHEYQLKLLLG